MKKLSLLLALLLALGCLSGIASADSADMPLLEITWAGHADTVPPAEEGTWFQKYLEDKWNVKITPLMITHMEQEAWDLYFSSGNTADYISNPGSRYNMLIDQQIVRPISFDMIETYTPNWIAKAIKMVGDKDTTYQMLTYDDGNVYCLPYIAYTAAFGGCAYIRTDWLDNLNLSIPTTLDEYHDVTYAFVYNDPDGNGEDDTLGISGANFNFHYIFGAYGIMKDTYLKDDEGKVTYTSVSDAYKEALKTLQSWWKEGLIDPEALTDNRAKLREKWCDGKIGIMNDNAWWGEESRGNNSVFNMLYNRDPDAKVSAFSAVTGPDGKSGAQWGFPGVTGQACVLFGADTSDEKTIRIMQIKESLTYIDEYIKGRYGEEGKTFTIDENGTLIMNPEWDFEQQRSLGIGQFYATQPQSIEDASVVLTPHDIETNNISLSSNLIPSGINFYAPRTNEAKDMYGSDVGTIVSEYYANAIMDRIDIDATWDDYVNQVKAAGLDEILAEYEEMIK